MSGHPANPLASTAADDQWYAGETWLRRGVRQTYDGLAAAALRHASGWGVRACGWAGACLHACRGQGPTAREVSAVFPGLTAREAAVVARASAALRFKNRAAAASFRAHGLTCLARLVNDDSARALSVALEPRTAGVVVTTFHVGVQFGVAAALARGGVPVLRIRDHPLDNPDARARALKLAVDTLRGGGVVYAVGDGPGGASSEPVPCLGRQIVLRRGAMVLARLTGAVIVLAAARWTRDGRISVTASPPLAESIVTDAGAEQHLAAAAAEWLERYLLAHPDDIWPYTLRNLIGAPRQPTK